MNWRDEDIITGERLQALAEVSVLTPPILQFHRSLPRPGGSEVALFAGGDTALEPDPRAIAQLHGKRSIFVYSHLLSSFVDSVLPLLDHRFVLISHNSDGGVDATFAPTLDDRRIAHWFAQNATIDHPKLTPLPIGIANAMWPHGDTGALVRAAAAVPSQRQALVYCNFEVRTNPVVRAPLREQLARSDATRLAPARPFADYLADMATCRWCVAPPGNGIDCHRTWEALYLGVVPITARTPASAALHAGLPVMVFDDLAGISKAAVEAEQHRLDAQRFDLSRLAMSYWRERVAEKVAQAT